MIEPTKEELAEALREYPTWGHAYVAEKARADGLEEQLESYEQAIDKVMADLQMWMPSQSSARIYAVLREVRPPDSSPASGPKT